VRKTTERDEVVRVELAVSDSIFEVDRDGGSEQVSVDVERVVMRLWWKLERLWPVG
jgi:hypothetical protein